MALQAAPGGGGNAAPGGGGLAADGSPCCCGSKACPDPSTLADSYHLTGAIYGGDLLGDPLTLRTVSVVVARVAGGDGTQYTGTGPAGTVDVPAPDYGTQNVALTVTAELDVAHAGTPLVTAAGVAYCFRARVQVFGSGYTSGSRPAYSNYQRVYSGDTFFLRAGPDPTGAYVVQGNNGDPDATDTAEYLVVS